MVYWYVIIMSCDRCDDQPSTSSGRTPRQSAERSCLLSWRHRQPTNADADGGGGGGGGSAAAICFDVTYVEKCRRHGAAEFEFPVETKSFRRQAHEFLTPLTASEAVREMLAEVCLDDESRERFGEAIAEYVQKEEVAERAVVEQGSRSPAVVEAALQVVTTVSDDDHDRNDNIDDNDDDYKKENNEGICNRASEEQK